MNKKDNIIINLNKLKDIYEEDPSKKWNLKALKNAIYEISVYKKEIISGIQLKNEINGIGDKIATRIDEIISKGFLKEIIDYENNKLLLDNNNNKNKNNNNNNTLNSINHQIANSFIDITGVGEVTAKKWVNLGIKDIDELKKAVNDNKITLTHHIYIGLKYYNDFKELIPRKEIDVVKSIIEKVLAKIDKEYIFEICGSYRRGASHSGDIDVLISHRTKYEDENKYSNHLINIVSYFKKKNFITDELTVNGHTKFMGVCKIKTSPFYRRIDIRFVKYNSYYSSLLYFTGNKNFNILMRKKALTLNMSVNEYGIIDNTNNDVLSFYSEKELFDKINMDYIEPINRNLL
jgi:DNA polymerase beta